MAFMSEMLPTPPLPDSSAGRRTILRNPQGRPRGSLPEIEMSELGATREERERQWVASLSRCHCPAPLHSGRRYIVRGEGGEACASCSRLIAGSSAA